MANYVMRSIFLFSSLLNCSTPIINPDSPEPIIEHDTSIIMFHTFPTPCPDDMVFIPDSHYCIDRYEAPNQEGEYPLYAQTAFQAESYCSDHKKQLCTHKQWYIACAGPEREKYPYGNSYRKGTCNDDKTGWTYVPWHLMSTPAWAETTKRLFKGELSGSRPACVSGYGVYDLTGNVAEWVREPHVPYKYVVKGGYWYGVMFDVPSCRFSNIGHSPDFASYEFGFRCCKNAN